MLLVDDVQQAAFKKTAAHGGAQVPLFLQRGQPARRRAVATACSTVNRAHGRVACSRGVSAGGVELAVFDVARSGRPRQYDTDAEARVAALACSDPPEGRQRWTMVELERVARQEPGLGGVSRETVRRMLKKMISSRGAS